MNLISEYGRLTIEEIRSNVLAYIGHQTIQAQKSVQMYHYIYNSITKAAYLKIVIEPHKYTIQGTSMGELF